MIPKKRNLMKTDEVQNEGYFYLSNRIKILSIRIFKMIQNKIN
jgi:hypothetical protein